jgi:DNA topoisomerase-3
MKKQLILAEKPSVARDIARVMNCPQKGNGYFEGKEYIVTWALGHLVTLADPEAYGDRYKDWRLEDLPMLPSQLKLEVIKQSGKQFQAVKAQLQRQDVSEIVIATDAGREGELVARWILEKANVRKTIKRLWISSVTDKAIREGFARLRPGKDYDNLYACAAARAEADWLVGINATRALTCKYNAQLSCGRVQTPTLAMIAQREAEIQTFKPQPYYGISAMAQGIHLVWQDSKSKELRIFDREKCDRLLEGLKGKDAQVAQVEKVRKKNGAPQLYDLTELQRDANKRFNYSAKETLSVMQRLYETHKVLTYPRTDSRYLSGDIVGTLPDRLKACSVGPYVKLAAKAGKPIRATKAFVDDSKVSDHHAIIPTEQSVNLGELNDKERKIYDLVVRRFLAVLYPPFEYEQTIIRAKIGEENFIAKGKIVIHKGWKEVYENLAEDEEQEDLPEQLLPDVRQGDTLKVTAVSRTQGMTKPPSPFNEAGLLSAMENPVKYMKNAPEALKKTIGEAGGLGTVATRADIIEKLFGSFLIEKKGKDIWITGKGKQLLELVPEELRSPELTAQWEQKLSAIAKGVLKKEDFVGEMVRYAQAVVKEIKNSRELFKHDNMTRSKCPECGKYLLEVNGKKGKMLVCQDRECGYRKGIAMVTNARCPNCHKKLELRGEGEGKIFVCPCGYREKLAAFQERKSQENSKVSKKEVANYLKTQQKIQNAPLNSSLAEALAKLKGKG